MANRNASRTAQGVALLRAAHQVLDAPPLILDDPVALTLLGPLQADAIKASPDNLQRPEVRALRAHVVLRSRFAEDRLAEAAARGVGQYVILGAGYDTFGYRQPDWAHALRVIEVDQPATQQAKRAQLAAERIVVPRNVEFVAVDFEHESLRTVLEREGVRFDVPTFFSWLGVTMYLREDAIDATLGVVAAFPAGSEIVLTFAQPRATDPTPDGRPSLAELAADVGEPWLSYFMPAIIERKLRDLGFTVIEFLTPAAAAVRYFANRSDDLPPPRRTAIVSARR